ncbi:hypothetical protein [Sphaerisporangium dianthi]|uniref:Uncharacterized protein n=1 Tax=Sphaerisporangium dianthi TaxID=1436120 RepID=A0ABV9CA96_9ACTN
MDGDGHPRSHDEDPLPHVDPLDIEGSGRPGRPGGDVLSDAWTPGHEPALAQGDGTGGAGGSDGSDGSDDSPDLVRADHERAEQFRWSDGREGTDGREGYESLEEFDYLYRREDHEASHDHERPEGQARSDDDDWATDGGGERGFLGSGWTGDHDAEEKGSKNKQLIFAMAAIVVLAVAGGWIVSTSAGSTPQAECSRPGNCASVERPDPGLTAGPSLDAPTAGPSAEPGETTAPGETPTPTASKVREPRQPSPRPTPTRTRVHSPRPSPGPSSRPQRSQDPRIEDEPEPSPTPPPTTQAPPPPPPAPSPTETGNGGLLDWIF